MNNPGTVIKMRRKDPEILLIHHHILLNGCVIKEIVCQGKNCFFIMPNWDGDEKPVLPESCRDKSLVEFPTEKGARAWCKKHHVKIIKVEKVNAT